MMMNFLDLSAASEEEKRLLSEILSDTSVVNFAESSSQHNQTNRELAHQNYNSRQQPNQQLHQNHHQHNHQLIKNKITHPLHLPVQQQPQLQQNHTLSVSNNINNQRRNHVHNHDTPVTSDNQRHANHVQVPSPMAGDINTGVVGMDMTTAQHARYPMGHHSQGTHVPPGYVSPHMYGGHPIFQPYPFMLPYPTVYGNMPPYSMLQMPPLTSRMPNTTVANNSHSRSHPHHSRQTKTKDQLSGQSSLNHNQTGTNNLQHQNQYNKPNHDTGFNDINVAPSEAEPDSTRSDYKQESDIDLAQNDKPHTKVVNGLDANSYVNIEIETEQHANVVKLDAKPINKEDGVVRVSSDEGFDTPTSSINISKQSQESSSMPTGDKSKSSIEVDKCGGTLVEESNQTLIENDKVEKTASQDSDGEKVAKQGPLSSAASKSWASLFKEGGNAMFGPSLNGESDQNIDVNNFDDENNRNLHRKSGGSDISGVHNSKSITSKAQRSQDAARRALDKMAPRLAQKINTITLKHSLPLLRPRGFINRGNGCYINSTLQALIACPPFYNLMKEIGDLKDLRRENSCTPILDNFVELFLNFPPLDASKKNKQVSSPDQRMQISQLQAEALEPKCIYDVLGQIKSECLKGAQEDAEEFLSSVLNGLHEEMIGLSETLQSVQSNNSSSQIGHHGDVDDINGDSNNDENLWREVGSKNRSLPIRAATVVNTPIQEIFGGSLLSIRTAGKDRCGHRSPFFDLQLDISGDNVKSLQDAIKSFTATEVIHDFYCSKTKQKLDAQRRTSLDQLPPILILHLKQFIYTQDHGLKKLLKRIEYPIDFELPDSCLHDKNSDKSLRNSRTYKLLAVVYHEGKEAVKGHYLTDVYHIGSSQWIRCDDSNLKVVPAPRIDNPESSRTPYLLFYRRLNTLKPQQPNNNNYNNLHDNNKKKS